VNGGATEIICDGIDNDCHLGDCCDKDNDHDGYVCADDCDDTRADINPGIEILPTGCYYGDMNCDGVDDTSCGGTT